MPAQVMNKGSAVRLEQCAPQTLAGHIYDQPIPTGIRPTTLRVVFGKRNEGCGRAFLVFAIDVTSSICPMKERYLQADEAQSLERR
jgi:hypothetical protein